MCLNLSFNVLSCIMNNTFFKERMIPCQQRELAQHPARLLNDQSHKSCRNSKIK